MNSNYTRTQPNG